MAKINSNQITFVDITDSRKLDIYINSNLPTTQIYNSNTGAYSPDWSTTNLQLTSDIYLDSKEITPETIQWYQRIGTTETSVGSNPTLTISTNVLSDNPIITYICKVKYQNIQAFREITFMRTDTGLNGSDGEDAPIVLAQYSIDGTTGWTSTLNTSTHKYIRHSYDGGANWTAAIKMVGEDGTSVRIKGTATSATKVEGTDYYTLVYNSSVITGAELGDSYLYGGNLYVCADSRDGQDYFTNVGAIQGPKGGDGLSSYVFIRYATDANGTNMSTSPSGKTYMGVYTSNTNTPPTTASVYTWSKFVGDNAKSITLSGDSQVFKVSKTNVITPSSIAVTAQAFNTTITNWTYSTNGGQTFLSTVPTGVSRNENVVNITGSTIAANSIVIKASDGQVEDVFTVYKAIDGADGGKGNDGTPAPIAFLTNENISFAANASGQVAATTFTTNVVAYSGTTKVTPVVGTPTGMPTGMTYGGSTTVGNELILSFTIANNSTLGSASSNSGTITIPITSPVITNLKLSWSKVNTGATGATGAAGSDAYTVILTNESHVFAGDVSNAIAGSTTTQVLAYRGATAQTVTISSVNGKTAATTDTDTGIAGLKFKCSALSGTSPTITFTCTTAFVSASGSIPIVLSVGGVSFTKMFTYSIAFKGEPGATGDTGQTGPAGVPATSYWLVSSASAVQKTSTGTIAVTPSTLTFTGKSQTGVATPIDYACRWIIAYSTDGTNYTNLYTSTANEASKSITVATTYKTIRARMYLAGGTATLLDEQIIPVVVDGTSASIVDITPSAYYFKSTTGKDGTFTPDYIYVYPRFQNVTFNKWEYSIDGGVTWVAASGANGLTIGTYSSVANALRIAKTSTLYTDAVTSISFRCVSSNAAVYDTVSIAKIYDVVDLQIGGRNLLLNSGTPVTNSLYNIKNYTLSIPPIIGDQYTITIKGTLGAGKTSFSAYNSGGTVSFGALKRIGTSDLYSLTFTWTNGGRTGLDTAVNIYTMTNSVTAQSTIEWIKLEKGNKGTIDWTPAPEDTATAIETVDTRITDEVAGINQTINSITTRVGNTETSIGTINGNISSLATRMNSAEQKITPTEIVSTVRSSTAYTNDLGSKVGNNEIISKINQTAESVTISANKIGLLGATNIPDLTADKIKGGTLTLGGSSATTQNGQLLVKNASNVDMLKVNKDGIVVKSGHLAVAEDFQNSTYDWDTGTWATTTNTSQLDLQDRLVQMGIYSSTGYSNSMRLTDMNLRFQGVAQGIGSWGSLIGHDSDGNFVVQDSVRSNISFRGYGNTEMASLSTNGLYLTGPVYGGVTSGNARLFTNVFVKNFNSQPTGYICVKLGNATLSASSMITIKGHITSYHNSTSFEASCYFYNSTGTFFGTVATMTNPDVLREVYFAERSGYAYLILGASNAAWSYPTIAIDSLSVGYAGNTSDAWTYGWDAVTYSNITSNFTKIAACARGGMKTTLWSGAVQIGATVTLSENMRNFKFLTCLMGDASAPWGITLGSFVDDELTELHFGAIFTGADSIAGGNLYGARFNINSQTSLSLQSMGTKNGAGAYLRKIVGWR